MYAAKSPKEAWRIRNDAYNALNARSGAKNVTGGFIRVRYENEATVYGAEFDSSTWTGRNEPNPL